MFPAILILTTLQAPDGVVLSSRLREEQVGQAVRFIGDINADGLADVAIGAPNANGGKGAKSGKVYVVFGRPGFPKQGIDLDHLAGNEGFVISGLEAGAELGSSVSGAGDVNGDGVDDLIVGAPLATVERPPVRGRSSRMPAGKRNAAKPARRLIRTSTRVTRVAPSLRARAVPPVRLANAGRSFVIFGQRRRFRSDVDVTKLTGRDGFSINGLKQGDRLGFAVSNAGDMNGDRIDDVIVTAPRANSPGRDSGGRSFVIFGVRRWAQPTFDLQTLDGLNGFEILGSAAQEELGHAVARAGDVDADGLSDVIIGAPAGSRGGKSYIIYGQRTNFAQTLDTLSLTGRDGMALTGFIRRGKSGFSVQGAGDVNGDRIDDVIIGAPTADPKGLNSGQSYVVFGRRSKGRSLVDLATLDGSKGFMIDGITGNSGFAVSGIGDVNGDGIDDLAIAAPLAQSYANPRAGQGYVLFGRTDFGQAPISLALLDGRSGFKLNGREVDERVGYAVDGRGDFNGDGLTDFVISAPWADAGGVLDAGKVYIIFGQKPAPQTAQQPQ